MVKVKKQHAILKIRHRIIKSVRDFFDNNNFTLVDTLSLLPMPLKEHLLYLKQIILMKSIFMSNWSIVWRS